MNSISDRLKEKLTTAQGVEIKKLFREHQDDYTNLILKGECDAILFAKIRSGNAQILEAILENPAVEKRILLTLTNTSVLLNNNETRKNNAGLPLVNLHHISLDHNTVTPKPVADDFLAALKDCLATGDIEIFRIITTTKNRGVMSIISHPFPALTLDKGFEDFIRNSDPAQLEECLGNEIIKERRDAGYINENYLGSGYISAPTLEKMLSSPRVGYLTSIGVINRDLSILIDKTNTEALAVILNPEKTQIQNLIRTGALDEALQNRMNRAAVTNNIPEIELFKANAAVMERLDKWEITQSRLAEQFRKLEPEKEAFVAA